MKAVIPVAGLGTRLRPHTFTTPKPLLEVAGKPILAHILDELVKLDAEEVTFIVHYFGDIIEEWVKKNYSFKSNFVFQEELLGLGHAISLAEPLHRDSDSVLIILGDTIFRADLEEVLKWKENAIGVRKVEDPRRFGIVELEDGKVSNLLEKPEKPPTNLAIVGIYNITQPALMFDSLDKIIETGKTTKGEIQLTDALQLMLKNEAVFRTFEIDGWYDCGKPETMLETNRELLKLNSTVEHSETIRKRYPEAVIKPPVAIHNSVKISDSVIGPYVTVGEGTEIENSIIRNSIIGKKAKVSDILMEGSLVGEETVANDRFIQLNISDSSEISIV